MILVKVPAINGLGKTKGCEKAPDLLSKEGKEIKVNNENIKETNKKIFNNSKEFFNDFPIFLGGDHSISFSLVNTFHSLNKDAALVVLDAHADCMPAMKEPTHEEWIRGLVESGFDSKNIFLIGLRKVEPEEMEFLKNKGINCFFMKELYFDFEKTCDLITEELRKFPSLYLSVDIDVVDPAFAPGTRYIEPAGLSSRELIYLLQRIFLLKNLKAVDLVEINPDKDINEMTVKLGKKIIEELRK